MAEGKKPIVTLEMLKEHAEGIKSRPVEHYEPELDATFLVRPVTYDEVLKIRSLAEGEETKFLQFLVMHGSVEPKIDSRAWPTLTQNTPGIAARLAAKISKISGLNSEAFDDAKNG